MVAAQPSSSSSLKLKGAVYRSDLGRGKKTNEDGVLCMTKVPLWAVADGTGGPEPARVALTVLKDNAQTINVKNADVLTSATTTARLAVGRLLETLFSKANEAVFETAEGIKDRRIATTLCAATLVGQHAFVAHVGDSRAYLYRDGKVRCLTNDHTLAALQLRRGDITPAEFLTSPFQRTLSQAIGMSPMLEVDLLELRINPGDALVVATNGLNRALSEEVLAACLGADGDTEDRADLIMRKVVDAGAPDNTTLILVETDAAARAKVRPEDAEAAARFSFLYRILTDTEWLQIQPYLETVELRTGDVIYQSGEAASGFGVVASGRLKLEVTAGETKEVFAGGHFGALALASEAPALETVTVLEASQVYMLSRPRFREILRLNPALGGKLTLALLESLGNRLGVLTSRLGHILDAANGKV